MKEYTLTEKEITELRKILDEGNGHSAHYIRTEFKNLFPELFREPLFTTEDGVEIFKGQQFYNVYNSHITAWTADDLHNDALAGKQFSTQQAAKEFLEQSQPKYSEIDLLQAVNNWAMCPIELSAIKNFIEKNGTGR